MKPEDLWKHVVAEAGEDEIERAASVSVEQAEKDLAAAGFDVAVERAKASAFLEALETGVDERRAATAVAKAAPRAAERDRRRPSPLWLAAAATMGGVLVYLALLVPSMPTAPRPVQPSPFDLAAAADLRRGAAAACDTQQWSVCLAKLDSARALDPDGDDTPTVKKDRDRAIQGILKPRSTP